MKVIKNGTLCLEQGLVQKDILFDQERIIEIGEDLKADQVIDASGLMVLPGLVDVHVHLREPGYTEKETISTGTLAAAKGGFTSIFAMPNVIPYPDDVDTIENYVHLISQESHVRTFPYACITQEEKGKEVVDIDAISQCGIRWFSDDGVGIDEDAIMKAAMEKAKENDCLIAMHTEDMKYRKPGASVHDSQINRDKGYIGIPSDCESQPLKRDLGLALETGVKYHGCHISAKESVDYLKNAKEKGGNITAEVTAHHLLLEDKDVQGPLWKMNPPLRSHEDRMALIEGLENGILDFIANDHAPHTMEEKSRPMDKAPFGIVSLETSFPLLYTEFVSKQKRWTLQQLLRWMSTYPAKRFGLKKAGQIKEGNWPDFVLVDLNKKSTVDINHFVSKGKNTPFNGWECDCSIVQTIVAGNTVWKEEV